MGNLHFTWVIQVTYCYELASVVVSRVITSSSGLLGQPRTIWFVACKNVEIKELLINYTEVNFNFRFDFDSNSYITTGIVDEAICLKYIDLLIDLIVSIRTLPVFPRLRCASTCILFRSFLINLSRRVLTI